ncbi:MAG: hypothetical protein IJA36_09875 [Lachnospiraceae bacterium]|nr:hypothetical protein [Lachnospiraceae bacterium]
MSYITNNISRMEQINYSNSTWKKEKTQEKYLEKKVLNENMEMVKQQSQNNQQAMLDAYKVMGGNKGCILNENLEQNIVSLLEQTSAVKDKAENDKYIVSKEGQSDEFWSIYNKNSGKKSYFYPAYSSVQTDLNTGEKYIIWAMWGYVGDAVKIDEELEEVLQEFMGIEEIKESSLNAGYEIRKDEFTGIETLMPKGNVLQGISFIETDEQSERLEMLAQKYLEAYPNIVKDFEGAKTYAMAEVQGRCWSTTNGILLLGGNALIYEDETNSNRNWSIRVEEGFQEGNLDVLKMITEAIERQAASGSLEKLENWLEVFEQKEEEKGKNWYSYRWISKEN